MKILKKTMIYLLITIAALAAATYFILNQKKFGKAPSGARLERILKSPHYG